MAFPNRAFLAETTAEAPSECSPVRDQTGNSIATGSPEGLNQLIEVYRQRHVAWLASAEPNGDLDGNSAESEMLEQAALVLLRFPCTTAEMAYQKIIAILELDDLYAQVLDEPDGHNRNLRLLLSSLLPGIKREVPPLIEPNSAVPIKLGDRRPSSGKA